jgi:uncharacterized RDD family membrane protein YckC
MNGSFFCNKCGAGNDASAQFCSRCGATLNPAGASSATVPSAGTAAAPAHAVGYPTAPGYPIVQAGVRYGGFWIRVVAAIIDFFIIHFAVHVVAAMFGLGGLAFHPGLHGLGHPAVLPFFLVGGGVVAAITLCSSWLYEALMESSCYQATLGKMIFGMKVTDLYGNRISFARATGRHFAKILSGMILCIGFIMVAFTERKQGLHDMIAGTLVRRF